MQLPVITQDKANHFIYGTVISAVTIVIGYIFLEKRFEHDILMTILAGMGIVSAIFMGILKELLDFMANRQAASQNKKPVHGVELADAIYTSLGGVLLTLPIIIVHNVK